MMRLQRGLGLALCILALIATVPTTTTTQGQDIPDFIGWEMGFVIPDGQEQALFDLEEDGATIQFWIRNDNYVDIEVALEYDSDIADSTSGPESATISSRQNETFSMTADGNSVWTTSAGTTYSFDIRGELTNLFIFEVPFPISSETIDGELIVPELHRWMVDFEDIGHIVNAGTESQIVVDLWNEGNTEDSINSYDLSDDCPLLTFEDDELSSFTGELVQMGSKSTINLNYDVSSTHPTRICKIELTVRSSGVADGGQGDLTNEGNIEMDVEAKPIGSQQDNDDASTNNDDGPQNQKEVESDNFLFAPMLITPTAILLAALLRRHEN